MDILRLIGFFIGVVFLGYGAKWVGLSILAPFGCWLSESGGGQLFLGHLNEGKVFIETDYALLGLGGVIFIITCIALPLDWYIRSLRRRVRAGKQ